MEILEEFVDGPLELDDSGLEVKEVALVGEVCSVVDELIKLVVESELELDDVEEVLDTDVSKDVLDGTDASETKELDTVNDVDTDLVVVPTVVVCSDGTSVEETVPTDDGKADTEAFSVLCDIVGGDVVELIAI